MSDSHLLREHYLKSDKVILFLNVGLVFYSLVLAPRYDTWAEALIIGTVTLLALFGINHLAPGTVVSRIALSASLMIITALNIHQAHGMIEMHFGIFVLLGALLYYRDWLPIFVAALVIAVHHFLFFYMQTQGTSIWVFSTVDDGWWVVFMHAGYVVVESALFIWLSVDFRKEAMQSKELMSLTNQIVGEDQIDLTLRSSGSTPLLKRFDGYTAEVDRLAQQVLSAAKQLNTNGEDLALITNEMKSGADIQQRETDMVATAVEEMSAAIEEVSRNAEMAAVSSNEVDESASRATTASEKTRQTVVSLAEKVNDASDKIRGLHGQTKSIGAVLDVIRGIAEQTNLLALNAAIEAARAGEQGRGFAVVADEVRTLAQRTQQSTEEIDKMIDSLQISSESVVQSIESSLTDADACVENTRTSLKLMETVSGSIGEVSQMNSMIATSASEQASVVGEISRNLSNILDASNKAAEDSTKAEKSGTDLLTMSASLDKLAHRFKVNNG